MPTRSSHASGKRHATQPASNNNGSGEHLFRQGRSGPATSISGCGYPLSSGPSSPNAAAAPSRLLGAPPGLRSSRRIGETSFEVGDAAVLEAQVGAGGLESFVEGAVVGGELCLR